jgi:hypothetical protein
MAEIEDLYAKPVAGPFAVLCGGGTDNDGSMEDCLTIADLAGGGYAVADTKPGGQGRELRFTADELTSFATEWLKTHA